MKIIEILGQKPDGQDLADRIVKEIRVRALNKLEHVRDLFPQFTDHSIRHCEGVISALDLIVPDTAKEQFNEWELYFLLSAAYLHDIGMVEGCPGSPEGPQWEQFYNSYKRNLEKSGGAYDSATTFTMAKRDFVRDLHHIRSEEYIKNHWIDLGLRASDTPAEGSIIGRIALGHRRVDLADRTQFGEIPFSTKLIRRDLLAAYLRLADELDTTAHRTPWAEYEVVQLYDETSAIEWIKHLSISGISITGGIIVVAGECHDHRVFLRLNRLQNDLKNKLVELKRMIRSPYATGDGFIISDPIPYHDIDLKIESIGYLPIDIKFELQDKEITQLIMGERLYGDKTACIRELLQNSIDTCREASENRPSTWIPEIWIKEESDGRILTVTDNGMGMDEYIIRKYFARVGISYYASSDFGGKFKPISQFGIGILSCFMMADQIEIDTLRNGKDPISLNILSLTESFIPRKGSRTETGTSVRLYLKKDLVGSYDLIKIVKHFAKHTEFPIHVTTREDKSYTLSNQNFTPEREDLLEEIQKDYLDKFERSWSSIRTNNYSLMESDGIQVGVTIFDTISPWWFKSSDASTLPSSSTRGKIFQHGFLIGTFAKEFSDIGRSTWCEVNIRGKSTFDLTVERNRIIGDKTPIWNKISELHSLAVEEIYKKQTYAKSGRSWWRYHLTYYPGYIDQVPKALAKAANLDMEICSFDKTGFQNLRLDQIKEWSGKIYFIDYDYHNELTIFHNLIDKDSLVIILPHQFSFYSDSLPWPRKLIAKDKNIQKDHSLLSDLGVKFCNYKIDDKIRSFIDTGERIPQWRLKSFWIRGNNTSYRPIFDLNNPFSKILVEWCQKTLPRESHLILKDIFRAVHNWRPDYIKDKQVEAVEVLKKDQVIPSNTELQPKESTLKQHDCPLSYRSD